MLRNQHFYRLHGDRVALGTQARHDAGRRHRDVGTMIDRFAPMHVRDMELDDRPLEHLQGVEKCNRGKGERGGIDDDRRAFIDGLVNPLDQPLFAIGLAKLDRPL